MAFLTPFPGLYVSVLVAFFLTGNTKFHPWESGESLGRNGLPALQAESIAAVIDTLQRFRHLPG
jgi:hypothetical protein